MTNAFPTLVAAAAAFREGNPSAAVDVVSVSERTLGEALANGRIHAAVCWDECVPAGLHTMSVDREPLCVLLPDDHPLAARDALKMADLKGCPLILPGKAGHPILYERFHSHIIMAPPP